MQRVRPETTPRSSAEASLQLQSALALPSDTDCPYFRGHIDYCSLRTVLLTIWLFSEKHSKNNLSDLGQSPLLDISCFSWK